MVFPPFLLPSLFLATFRICRQTLEKITSPRGQCGTRQNQYDINSVHSPPPLIPQKPLRFFILF